ncbi:MAG TPA: ParA family protein [Propionibacteriaceae bacterium]
MRVIASYNLKGGVGKTTAAVNLAYLSSVAGHRTLLWDLDPQGAATYLMRVRPRVKGGSPKLVRGSRPMMEAVKATDYDGLDLLPADFTYRHMDIDLNGRPNPQRTLRRLLAPLSADYDRVILDTPPSLSLVSENVIGAADLVLVPLIPTVLSVRTFDQLVAFVDESKGHKPAIRGYFSMLDRRRKLHRDILTELPTDRGQMSTVAIPSASAVEQMAVRRAPLMEFAPRSPAAVAFQQLWEEMERLP